MDKYRFTYEQTDSYGPFFVVATRTRQAIRRVLRRRVGRDVEEV